MASLFFQDYFFPSELYDQTTGHFTTPIQTLVEFAPHILQELPKQEKDQKPMKSTFEDSWTKKFTKSSSYLGSLLTSDVTKSMTEFVIRCGNEYLKQTAEKKRERDWRYTSKPQKDECDSEEEREKKKKQKDKDEDKNKGETQVATKDDNSTLVKTAAAASLLSFTLYSTYQAGVTFSDISFHNQLEILLDQVHSIVQSTDVWIKEHETLGDKVPSQVISDLSYLKELVSFIERLDPRSHKRLEAAGWGFGALGGLSTLGALAWGSATVATGGAALAVGGTIVWLSSKAQAAGKSNLGARLLLENQVRDRLSLLNKDKEKRQHVIQNDFNKKQEPISVKSKYTKEEPVLIKESVKKEKKKEKIALAN